MRQSELRYTIQELSQKLNIPKPTLRYWEKELCGIIVPHRTQGGQRRYTIEDLQVISEINQLRKDGISIADIKNAFDNRLKQQDGTLKSTEIDHLADRIAEIVKDEIYRFINKDTALYRRLT
jgi:DNA-binding transcriptional MerR regulator